MHGFNRLGGNSVAETVVGGMIVGEFIADFCEKPENGIDIPTSLIYDAIAKVQNELDGFIKNSGTEDMVAIRTRMQDLMTSKIGIFRTGADMESGRCRTRRPPQEDLQGLLQGRRGQQPRARLRLPHPQDAQARSYHCLRRCCP